MDAFHTCRRAWDLGARVRRDLVPRVPVAFDLDLAIHAGLAVYYFPAMDDWSRSIVRPLALEGFHRAMREARVAYEEVATFDAATSEGWSRAWRLGDLVLHRYFGFAAAFDDFDSVLADDDLWTPLPDPERAGAELGTHDGRPIRYLCRLDQLIADPDDEWWVVEHRLSWGAWARDEELLDEQGSIRTLWALETAYPQIHVAGTVHNELLITERDEAAPVAVDPASLDVAPGGAELDRRDMSAGVRHTNLRRSPITPEERIVGAAFDRDDEIAHREEDQQIRRTWVRRGHGDLHMVGNDLAREALMMIDPAVDVGSSPAPDTCGRCAFLEPCLLMETGADAEPALASGFRRRLAEEFDEAGLRTSAQRVRNRAHLGGASLRSASEPPAADRRLPDADPSVVRGDDGVLEHPKPGGDEG